MDSLESDAPLLTTCHAAAVPKLTPSSGPAIDTTGEGTVPNQRCARADSISGEVQSRVRVLGAAWLYI